MSRRSTSGREAISIALSINSIGVTQTGQPGPWTSVMSFGKSASTPYLTMVCVWPAADLHDRPRPGDLAGDRGGHSRWAASGIPIFIHVFHGQDLTRESPQLVRARSISWRYENTSCASLSSRRLIAMPTCTIT